MLLATSAIAGDRTQDAWFNALDHNSYGGVSLDELRSVQNAKFYLLDINHDNIISLKEVAGSSTWSQRTIRLDTYADSLVNLAEFETMGATVYSVTATNTDSQITAHEALKFQHRTMKQASTRKVFN